VFCGMEPWPPRPCTVILMLSAADKNGPEWVPAVPATPVRTCWARATGPAPAGHRRTWRARCRPATVAAGPDGQAAAPAPSRRPARAGPAGTAAPRRCQMPSLRPARPARQPPSRRCRS
jgi:hypothetical protein